MKLITILLLITAPILLSAQSGITWNMGMNISTNNFGNYHPRITLDGSGNPMVIWGRFADKSVYFTRWNGTAFTTPVRLNPMGMDVATASWMGPSIASKGDTVYVVVKRAPEAADTNHVFIMRSFNGGLSFSTPFQVSFIADSISRFPVVSVDDTGNPVVAFMKFNPNFTDARWVVARSADFGDTFSTDVKASGWSGPAAEVCDCCPGALVQSGNTTTMLYRDNLANIRDTWAGVSFDGGTTFGNGFNIDGNNWFIPSCPSSGPDGVIIGDTLYSTFMSAGSGSYRTYFSRKSISGGGVALVNNLTGAITGLTQQNYPRMASYGTAVGVVWKQNISGVAELPILFTNNIANGFPAYEVVDLNDITNTDIAIGDGKVFVVWQDDNSGTVKYRSGTFTPLSTGINEFAKANISLYPVPAGDIVNLSSDVSVKEVVVLITDLSGKIIFEESIPNLLSHNLNISHLKSGAYFLKLTSGENIVVKKLVKI
jgi:hypothetical protein